MAYFPDLSAYTYDHRAEPDPKVLNVGWLSDDEDFVRGPVSERFISTLRRLAPINLYKGHHNCEFCPRPIYTKTKRGLLHIEEIPGTTGNGEIHVPGPNGITFVAPTLILHYVTEHQYLPPQEFIDAVLRQP
jgi:hypothetical protein